MRHSRGAGRSATKQRTRAAWAPWVIGALTGLWALGCVGEMAQPPEPVACAAKSSRTCFCADGDTGVQSCNGDGEFWSDCRCSCSPGDTEECNCDDGEIGLRECHLSGDFWTACQCLTEEERIRRDMQLEDDPRCGVGENYCEDIGCVNLSSSDANCGGCGIVCEGCDRCYRGVCTTVCCADETNCGSPRDPVCTTLDSDPDNCGACGAFCDNGEICLNGDCVPR